MVNIRFFLCSVLCLLGFIPAGAVKFEADGVYYNLTTGNSVEVTFRGDEEDGWMYYSDDELYVGDVVIPDSVTYNGATYAVTAVGNDAFAGSKLMASLVLPATVSKIGSGAFSLCNGLSSIVVDEDNASFFSLNSILYQYPNTIFFVPRNIQGDVELYADVTAIPSAAFQNCAGITSITLPDGVKTIADGAFNACTGLNDIFFNDGVVSIGEHAFSKCANLSVVNIPSSVQKIGAAAFTNCDNLIYLILNEGLISIGKMAFYSCPNVVGVALPSTLTSIGDQAFDLCYSLDVVMNNSSLDVKVGDRGNGCVAYYASEVIGNSTAAGLSDAAGNVTYCQLGGVLQIANAEGRAFKVYAYNGQLLYAGVVGSRLEELYVGPQRVFVVF